MNFSILSFRICFIFLLDLLLGEPSFIVHPVVLIGKLISKTEKVLRKIFPRHERFAGFLLVIFVCALSFGIPFGVLHSIDFLCGKFFADSFSLFGEKIGFSIFLDLWWGYQCVAARCLRDEAVNVYKKLSVSIQEGRNAVARIVGRETKNLSEEGVIKACVETVAENTTDGIFSPVIFYAIGGAPLAMLYKAINTMDSMIGYKNEKYRFFGTAAARLDDIANFIPARIAAFFMMISGSVLRFADIFSFKKNPVKIPLFHFVKIFFRDRYKHESPNSAQTESVMAGILGVQLNGDAVYEGKIEHKPSLGDALRPIEKEDILRSVKVMYGATMLFAAFLTFVFFYLSNVLK